MYPHHVFDLEPVGTFGMYPICYWRVSGRYFQPEPAMYSRCFHWFPGPLAPSVDSLVNGFCRRIDAVGIVSCRAGILDVVLCLELLETLSAGIINILGVGNELGRRGRSVGSRHFEWRMGWWFKGQRLTLLLSAHDRHALCYGLLFPSLGIHLIANWTNPGSSLPTLFQCSLVCGLF